MPIWLPPKDTNSMLDRNQRLKMGILASAAFSRMKEVENVELRKKQKEKEEKRKKNHRNRWIAGAVVLGSIGCLAAMGEEPDPHKNTGSRFTAAFLAPRPALSQETARQALVREAVRQGLFNFQKATRQAVKG
jgi:hypothetical protein